ncbi:MAG TPA: hypothetical protein PK466_02300 [Thermotogota bacterium]|nr:hypothetical protein [Thermotogota bacterium]
MKKLTFFITILILLSVSLFSETGNFYWYRTSEDTPTASVSVFPKTSEVDEGYWHTGDWVLFSISGDVEVTNTATIKGTKGWKIGSNSSENHKFEITNNAKIYSEDFWIGPGMTGETVITIPSWWKWEGGVIKEFYNRRLEQGENPKEFFKLNTPETFDDPSEGFPLMSVHFTPHYLAFLEEKEDLMTSWDSNIIINSSGKYENITINSNRTITIEVAEEDIVIQIRNFNISGQLIVKVKDAVENPGRVFLFLENYEENGGGNELGTEGFKDFYVFYTGNNDFTLGETNLYGNVYLLNSGFKFQGSSKGIYDVLSIADGDKWIKFISAGSGMLHSIYSQYSDIEIGNTGKITGGIVSGGSDVNITNVNSLKYIYAPKALITFGNTGLYEGTYIGNRVIINNVVTIQGPPVKKIEKPIIPQPEIPSYYDDEWLVNLDVRSNQIKAFYPVPNIYGVKNDQKNFTSNGDINIYIYRDTKTVPFYVSLNGEELGPWKLLIEKNNPNKKIQEQESDILKLFDNNPKAGPEKLKAVNIQLPDNYTGIISYTRDVDDSQFNPIKFKVNNQVYETFGGSTISLEWKNGEFIKKP